MRSIEWWLTFPVTLSDLWPRFQGHSIIEDEYLKNLARMWVSRPGLGLETDQDHFFEVLVSTLLVLVLASLVLVSACLVLVSEGGLEQDLRLCVC